MIHNKKTDTLSVIVAVYNTEAYLEKCLLSIVNQEYSINELILIDDGSTDSSGEICDDFADRYNYIKVVHQENKGQLAAQRYGIEIAKSKYVSFIDSDDYVDTGYFGKLMNAVLENKAEAVITNEFLLEEKGNYKIWKSTLPTGNYDEKAVKEKIIPNIVRNEILAEMTIIPCLPGKIFCRDKLIKTSHNLDNRIRLGEDGAMTFPYILDCKSVTVIPECGYHYVQHSSSVSQKPNIKYFEELKILQNYLQDKMSQDKILGSTVQSDIYLRDLLIITIRKFYGVEMGRILCIPPYECIDKGCNLVIYGAGLVGQSFVKQILHSNYANIVGWIDANSTDKLYGIQIQSPNNMGKMKYDKILIAINEKHVADTIKDYLTSKGVFSEKIVWKPIYWG